MKKAILIFSLIVFVLVGFSANGNTQSNVSSDVKQIVLQPGDDDNSTYLAAPDGDDKKCKKCGKENCKCDKTKSDKSEKMADILAQQVASYDDINLDNEIFMAAMNTEVEEDIYHLMVKHQQS